MSMHVRQIKASQAAELWWPRDFGNASKTGRGERTFSQRISRPQLHSKPRSWALASAGIKGNHFYVEKDVAVAVSYIEACHAMMALAKFDRSDPVVTDPYCYHPPDPPGTLTVRRPSWRVYDPFVVGIMNYEYVFRRLDPLVLTNLQLFMDYLRLANEQDPDDPLAKSIRGILNSMTPGVEEIRGATNRTHLFLFMSYRMESDYNQFVNCS